MSRVMRCMCNNAIVPLRYILKKSLDFQIRNVRGLCAKDAYYVPCGLYIQIFIPKVRVCLRFTPSKPGDRSTIVTRILYVTSYIIVQKITLSMKRLVFFLCAVITFSGVFC